MIGTCTVVRLPKYQVCGFISYPIKNKHKKLSIKSENGVLTYSKISTIYESNSSINTCDLYQSHTQASSDEQEHQDKIYSKSVANFREVVPQSHVFIHQSHYTGFFLQDFRIIIEMDNLQIAS